MSKRGSRCTSKKPTITNTLSPLARCQSPFPHYGQAESPRNLSPSQNFLFPTTRRGEIRRWSVASLPSSGYTSNATESPNVSSRCTFQEKYQLLPSHPAVQERRHLPRLSSNESSPGIEEDGYKSPLLRSRSRSLSPVRSPGVEDDIIVMNSVYKERFPKATRQMEDRLEKFIEDSRQLDPDRNSDAVTRFAHFQVMEMARDCLQKSQEKLVTSHYFHEMSENLEKLYSECREKSSTATSHLRNLIKNLLLIVSRPARLLECLEFDPGDFYRLLEAVEGQAKVVQGVKFDMPQYIITKLGLNRDPLAEFTSEVITGESGDAERLDKIIQEQLEASLLETQRTRRPSEDSFETIKLISNGAYGAVYLVRHKETRERFAMKKINKQNLILRNQIEQAFAERDIMSFTDNPFVVGMFCTFETKKHLCMVMEYVEGGDCATLVKNMGPLPLDMARFYFAETVLAVEYLHSYGIVHRDLKPDNLLITAMGHIKLTDFGLSKIGLMNLATNLYEGCLDRDTKLFNDKQVIGTPEYIAPEVILRQGYGKPVDWWSMGIILYEFCIGCVPFFGETPEKLFAHVINDEVEWPDEVDWVVPDDAKDLITHLLRQHPIDRLGTGGAHEVKEHLFFIGMDWESLLRQKAEFVPQLSHEEDTSYFDTRAERYNHEMEESEEMDDVDDSSLFSSFSSCSPQFMRVYSCVDELDEENLLRLARQESALKTGSNTELNQTENIETECSPEKCGEAGYTKSISTSDLNFSLISSQWPPANGKNESKNTATQEDEHKTHRKQLTPQFSANTGKYVQGLLASSIDYKPSPLQPPGGASLIARECMKLKKHAYQLEALLNIPIPSSPASASGLSLIIPADGIVSQPVIPLSGSSSTNSRDTSPNREASSLVPYLKPPIIIRKGPRGFGFTARAIRVYFGDSDVYTIQHLVSAVDNTGPAFESQLKPGDLITHINGEPLQGLVHHQVLQLILSGGDRITIRTTPLESTTIKSGGRNRHPSSIKMVRCPVTRRKRYGQGKRETQSDRKRRTTLLRKLSNKRTSANLQHLVSVSPPVLTTSHSLHSLSRGDEVVPGSPKRKGSRSPTSNRLRSISESSCSTGNSGSNSSSSSIPGSPTDTAQFQRPSSLHGLKHKLIQTFCSPRRKSVEHLPLSPLVRTLSPSPLRSTSPLAFLLTHYPVSSSHTISSCSTLTPTSVDEKIFIRPKNAEPCSPLLKRVLPPDRLCCKFSEAKFKQEKVALSSLPVTSSHDCSIPKTTETPSSFSLKKESISKPVKSEVTRAEMDDSYLKYYCGLQQDEISRADFSFRHSEDPGSHGLFSAVRQINRDTYQPCSFNSKLKTVDQKSAIFSETEKEPSTYQVMKDSSVRDFKDRRSGIQNHSLSVITEDVSLQSDNTHQSKEDEQLKVPFVSVTMSSSTASQAFDQKLVIKQKLTNSSVPLNIPTNKLSVKTHTEEESLLPPLTIGIQNITIRSMKSKTPSTAKSINTTEGVSKPLCETSNTN